MWIYSLITLLIADTSLSDNPHNTNNAWNVKFSDPSRGGRFLNVPIHYGDWVPITAAKALVESVANTRGSSRPAEAKEDVQVTENVETSDRRADHGDFKFIDYHRQRQQHRPQPHFRPVHQHNNNRRQDASKSFRFNPHLNSVNVDGNRRNTKKLPQPSPTHFNHIGQNVRPKPQQQSAFSFVPSFNSLSAFNPLNYFFDTRDPVTTPSPRSVSGPVQDTTNNNAIKTIQAPDLSKYGPGPPVIELDSGADGEIILGQPFHAGHGGAATDRDHLAGFVSLDFDGFTSGDQLKKPKRKVVQPVGQKEKLSIIVGGKAQAKPRDQTDLVNFLNSDRDNTDTFVFSSDKNPPQGFAKIDLPFMDPTKHQGDLPKAFIAPKGIPIPDGYKGKPLPHQPNQHPSTTEKVLIHQTNKFDRDESLFRPRPSLVSRLPETERTTIKEPTTTEKTSLLTSQLRFKNRNRPSLTEFIRKNKEKVALLDEKTDSVESNEKPGYFNDKIQETRKEFKESYSPSDVIIPVENNFNTFKLVTDNDASEQIVDIISAGDDDNDPISLVFDPVLTHSTLEQADDEGVATTEKEEVVTSFAPTVPTTVADTDVDTTTAAVAETTTTVNATTTTTTVSTTSYKITTQDPFARLESLRKQKFKKISTSAPSSYQGDLVSGEDISPSTESPSFNFASPFRNRFRPFKKFDNLPEDFGRRTRKKKKTGIWVKKYSFKGDNSGSSLSVEPTRRPYVPRARLSSYTSTTTTESAKIDEFKQKYRPIFEGLYSQLTTEKTETTQKEDGNRRFGLPIRRSTTPSSAYTVDAEVYEVHPKTRLRITTRTPTTKAQASQTTTELKSIDVADTDYYTYQDDYVYEPTTAPKVVEVEDEVVTSTTVSEYVPTVNTEQVTTESDDVHETADKHSTTTLPTVRETTFNFNELDNEIPDQLVEESQRVETTWNGVLDVTSGDVTHTVSSTTTTNARLSSYDKVVDTSKYGDDKEYNVEDVVPQINEHSKQVASGDNDASWQPSPVKPDYTEIHRGVAKVEEVHISETNQAPDIIYDVTKDGFTDDAVDTFSVPVAVAFNVPAETVGPTVTTTESVEAETTQASVDNVEVTTTAAAETTTAVAEQEATTTVAGTTTTEAAAPVTTVTEEATTTTTHVPTTSERYPTTYSRIYNLIQRNRNNLLATTSRPQYGEVYLGSRPTTTERQQTVIDLSKSAHKIPNSLWSSFEKSRDTDQHEDNTEGYKEASIMSYSNPATNDTKVVAELPKPSKHESEVLVEKVEKITGGGFVPKKRISVKNKEKWLKDLVNRKFSKKPKFPRGPLLPLAPNKPESSFRPVNKPEKNIKNEISAEAPVESVSSLFAPTMPPKKEVTEQETERKSLLDRFSSRQKTSSVISNLYNKEKETSPAPVKDSGVPRGARTELFRNFGGASLSQADFERTILGVSTATEISVKSMICVKGRCFNADDAPRRSNY